MLLNLRGTFTSVQKQSQHLLIEYRSNDTVINSEILHNQSYPKWDHQAILEQCSNSDDLTIYVYCADETGKPIAGFPGDSMKVTECIQAYCPLFAIDTIIGECDAAGLVPVNITISGNITDPDCLPYALGLEFDRDSGKYGPPILITSTGKFSRTIEHHYNPATSLYYTAILHTNHGNGCENQSIPISLEAVQPHNSCPVISNIEMVPSECSDDCEKHIEIRTFFEMSAQSNQQTNLHWQFFDSCGVQIPATAKTFCTNSTPSPHVDNIKLLSAQSPVVAKLVAVYLDGSDEVLKEIDLEACAGCTKFQSFDSTDDGCVQIGEAGYRAINFNITGTFCGEPEIRINYGDGNYDHQIISRKGQQTIQFKNKYITSGCHHVTLDIITPSGCTSYELTINVPEYNSVEVVEAEKFSHYFWLFLTAAAYYLLWAFDLYQQSLTLPGITANASTIGHGLFALGFFLATLRFLSKSRVSSSPAYSMAKCFTVAVVFTISLIVLQIAFGAAPVLLPNPWVSALLSATMLGMVAVFKYLESRRHPVFLTKSWS